MNVHRKKYMKIIGVATIFKHSNLNLLFWLVSIYSKIKFVSLHQLRYPKPLHRNRTLQDGWQC